MAVYNDTFMNNATNLLDLINGINNITPYPYLIGHLILFSFFMIYLIMSLRHDFTEVLLYDSFLTSIIAILMFAAGMIAPMTVAFPIILFIIVLVYYLFS